MSGETTRIFRSSGIAHSIEGDELLICPSSLAAFQVFTPATTQRLARRVPPGGRVYVDLQHLPPSGGGSMTVAALVMLAQAVEKKLILIQVPPAFAEALHLLGVDDFFDIITTPPADQAPPQP